MAIIRRLILTKEARLFDAKEFLLKTFVAVALGYLVGMWNDYVSKDMISLLFGMMLTIEPVNLTGVRSGLKQLEATILGAIITGVILMIFGYNAFSAALAVTATLYVSLVIDWRQFSVVAVFTSIYMTQYVQLNAAGQPSEIRTFSLRIAALMTGVAIAFLVNWIFSIFGYKQMFEKRLYHLLTDLRGKMTLIGTYVKEDRFDLAHEVMGAFPSLFNNIDWIFSTVSDYKKDPLTFKGDQKKIRLEKIGKLTQFVREISHLNYDVCYRMTKGDHHYKETAFIEAYDKTLNRLNLVIDQLEAIIRHKPSRVEVVLPTEPALDANVHQMDENIHHMNQLLTHY